MIVIMITLHFIIATARLAADIRTSLSHQPRTNTATRPRTAPNEEACSLRPEDKGDANGLESVGSVGPLASVVVPVSDADCVPLAEESAVVWLSAVDDVTVAVVPLSADDAVSLDAAVELCAVLAPLADDCVAEAAVVDVVVRPFVVVTTTTVLVLGCCALLAAALALEMAELGIGIPRTWQLSSSGLRTTSTETEVEHDVYMHATTSGRKLLDRDALHIHLTFPELHPESLMQSETQFGRPRSTSWLAEL